MRVLITGGAGFIGHHMVDHLLKNTDHEMVCLDRLDTSGNLNRLSELLAPRPDRQRVKVLHHDLKAAINSQLARQIGPVNVILHLAAASHVDRSITDPMSFVMDNVVGTCNLLEYARSTDLDKLMYFSTDEVFGPCLTGAFKEWDRYKSANPYSASKAGAEELCVAYENTYKLPVVISHCMNVIGERQHPEKFVPLVIRKVLNSEPVTIHANASLTVPGSRFYIHARNVAAATLFLMEHGATGDKYNIVGEREVNNLELAQFIAAIVGKPLQYKLVDFAASRPGHDLRYGLDGSKLAAMGWKPPVNFEQSLTRTVQWFVRHPEWL